MFRESQEPCNAQGTQFAGTPGDWAVADHSGYLQRVTLAAFQATSGLRIHRTSQDFLPGNKQLISHDHDHSFNNSQAPRLTPSFSSYSSTIPAPNPLLFLSTIVANISSWELQRSWQQNKSQPFGNGYCPHRPPNGR